ncbi:Apyrase [Necator americanus]|uniref:Apyrase n=1 Tax=Necator americanus TaxID=51031 RepID=W2SK38_NECAM|nr:Apyrase [Necator americanus]ETN69226.1 Apyrase [Necator americanus]
MNNLVVLVTISPRVITRTKNGDGSTTYNLLLITDMDAHSRAEEWKWRAISRKANLTLSASKMEISPRVITRTKNADGSTTYNLLLITDMDADSRAEEWKWRAISRKAKVTLSADKKEIKLDWIEGSDVNLTTGFNFKGRGMELSDLSEFNGHLISPDDKTGLLYEIKKDKAIPWVFLNSGPGNTTKGMKAEWLTIKDDLLYAGGHGTVASSSYLLTTTFSECVYTVNVKDFQEYLNSRGKVANDDAMWIKTITKTGKVTSHYWKNVYNTIRNTAQFPAPGYLTHEAVQWSKAREMWYFLPRKASKTPFVEEEDETKGTNLLIMGPEDLESVDLVYIGNRTVEHPERGFSAFDFIPDTEDELILAIKSKEVTGSEPESFITVFNVHGKALMEDQQIAGNYKFEAVYFAIPWVFLNSGPGNTTKGMKAEWLTIKDDLLYAGGHGTEYLNSRGKVANDDAMWIKTITKTGKVTSHYWKNVYNTIRNTAQFPAPGYLTHEAVQWSKAREMWYFLPRKASKTPFVEEEDETKGTNLLIMGPEDLESVDVVYIGNRTVEHPERGFSAFDFIPDTEDELILAIKSKEVTGSEPESFITVFNVHGKVIMKDQRIDGNYKFEAVYFV